MSLEKLSINLKNVPINIQEMIDLYNQIPSRDPDKYLFYKNIETIIELELEKNSSKHIQIKLLNDDGSGRISLDQLSKTSEYVQNAYSNAIGKIVGISDRRNRKYKSLEDETTIIAKLKAGSFIISVDSIGKVKSDTKMDLLLEDIKKEDTLSSIIYEAFKIQDVESLDNYINKFGYRSLKNIQKWFANLAETKTPFEFSDNKFEKIEFSLDKIENIEKLITEIEFEEQEEEYNVTGKVLKIDSIKNDIIIKDLNLGKIEIKLNEDFLQDENISDYLKINKYYSCKVKKQVVKYPTKTKVTYFRIK